MKKILFIIPVIAIIAAILLLTGKTEEKSVTLPKPPLKDLAAKHNIDFGNFAIFSLIHEQPYKQILTEEFNLALIDNTPNWHFSGNGGLRPAKDKYYFDDMDKVVQYAEDHKMKIQAHHYLWGEEKWLPDWLKKGKFSKEELDVLMQEHIQTVGSRYSGKIQEWTVVNEAFSRGQNVFDLNDWWADNTGGKEYIDKAFRWARAADPNSKLILNDFGNEAINSISDEMYNYVKDAKARGVPIDGIGMQMHIDGSHPPVKDEVIANMKRFKALGVDVYVTEFDVNMNDVPAERDDRDNIQGIIYYEMLRACIESEACVSFAYLGITDKETWYKHIGLKDPSPLLFDEKYEPKPAFYSTRNALLEQ